jgi:hypothetical protein
VWALGTDEPQNPVGAKELKLGYLDYKLVIDKLAMVRAK